MPRCIKCNYELVLLLNRLKYKCSLCSRLYPQKFIENREFRAWNEMQRGLDIQNLIISIKPKPRLMLSEKTKKCRPRLTEEERKIKELERCDKYKEANWKRLSLTSKRWLENNREKRYEFLNSYKLNNKDLYKQKQRLAYWRTKQKLLADQHLKNNEHTPSAIRFFPSSPTFSLCELLK